jgi:CDP-paratose 2-epimerase
MSTVLVTGACGFIGTCFCHRLRALGHTVIGIDNLSRRGSELNTVELGEIGVDLHRVDVSNAPKLFYLMSQIGPVDAVFHLSAQVAVTSSYANRQVDFYDNALASFNMIEAVKRYSPEAYCLYASTNKVYGHITVSEPVGVNQPTDPYTPYGVSKAAGEMYWNEYGRPELGLTTCSLRQSCIYGHHQFGVEDQGWVAWFTIANLLGETITLYGDGLQVRDLLFVDDLIDLYLESWEKRLTGAWPVGGGAENAINLRDCLALIEKTTGTPFAEIREEGTRPGDQPYFVADMSWTKDAGLAWQASTSIPEGVEKMTAWIRENEGAIRRAVKR